MRSKEREDLKGKIYRLYDDLSHMCISEKDEVLVFAQVYYLSGTGKSIMNVNLDNIKLIPKKDVDNYEYLENKKEVFLEFELRFNA